MASRIIEEQRVKTALDSSNGNQRIAAQKLQVSQAWLVRWLKRNGFTRKIEWVKGDK